MSKFSFQKLFLLLTFGLFLVHNVLIYSIHYALEETPNNNYKCTTLCQYNKFKDSSSQLSNITHYNLLLESYSPSKLSDYDKLFQGDLQMSNVTQIYWSNTEIDQNICNDTFIAEFFISNYDQASFSFSEMRGETISVGAVIDIVKVDKLIDLFVLALYMLTICAFLSVNCESKCIVKNIIVSINICSDIYWLYKEFMSPNLKLYYKSEIYWDTLRFGRVVIIANLLIDITIPALSLLAFISHGSFRFKHIASLTSFYSPIFCNGLRYPEHINGFVMEVVEGYTENTSIAKIINGDIIRDCCINSNINLPTKIIHYNHLLTVEEYLKNFHNDNYHLELNYYCDYVYGWREYYSGGKMVKDYDNNIINLVIIELNKLEAQRNGELRPVMNSAFLSRKIKALIKGKNYINKGRSKIYINNTIKKAYLKVLSFPESIKNEKHDYKITAIEVEELSKIRKEAQTKSVGSNAYIGLYDLITDCITVMLPFLTNNRSINSNCYNFVTANVGNLRRKWREIKTTRRELFYFWLKGEFDSMPKIKDFIKKNLLKDVLIRKCDIRNASRCNPLSDCDTTLLAMEKFRRSDTYIGNKEFVSTVVNNDNTSLMIVFNNNIKDFNSYLREIIKIDMVFVAINGPLITGTHVISRLNEAKKIYCDYYDKWKLSNENESVNSWGIKEFDGLRRKLARRVYRREIKELYENVEEDDSESGGLTDANSNDEGLLNELNNSNKELSKSNMEIAMLGSNIKNLKNFINKNAFVEIGDKFKSSVEKAYKLKKLVCKDSLLLGKKSKRYYNIAVDFYKRERTLQLDICELSYHCRFGKLDESDVNVEKMKKKVDDLNIFRKEFNDVLLEQDRIYAEHQKKLEDRARLLSEKVIEFKDKRKDSMGINQKKFGQIFGLIDSVHIGSKGDLKMSDESLEKRVASVAKQSSCLIKKIFMRYRTRSKVKMIFSNIL